MATAKKMTQAAKIRIHAAAYPNRSVKEIADKLGVRYATVYNVLKPNVKTPKVTKFMGVTIAKDDITNLTLDQQKRMADNFAQMQRGRNRAGVTQEMLKDLAVELKAERVTMVEPPADNVNHPAHYKVGGIETIDFIEAKNLSYHLGNVVKYIARADTKGNREEDLLKARWYLNREIAKFGK